MSTAQALVLNSSHPEVDQLAAELSARGLLETYVGRYTMRSRSWERMLLSLPGLSGPLSASVGRRKLPVGLDPSRAIEAGVLYDLTLALATRLHSSRASLPFRLWLLGRREIAMQEKAVLLKSTAPVVIGNYSLSRDLFRQTKARKAIAVMNYPIAHHRFAEKLLLEEADLHPEFADSLRDQIP